MMSGNSLIKIMNKVGPRIEPCATPTFIWKDIDDWPFKINFIDKKERIKSKICTETS